MEAAKVEAYATAPPDAMPPDAMPPPDATATEQNLAAWDALYAQGPRWSRYPPEELSGFIAQTFPDAGRGTAPSALEIGCGPGANLWFLAREGFTVAGIDGSAVAIARAQERLAGEGLGGAADLRIGNFACLPWPAACFDVVVDIQSISHNTTLVIEAVFAEIHRVLKPGGWFFGRMFGDRTTGILSGERIDARTTRAVRFGPLTGCGIVHGFSRAELEGLLSRFISVRLDYVHRRIGQTCDIDEWIVQAQKP